MLVPFFCLNNKERQYIIYISLQACWNLAAGCGNPQSAHASTSRPLLDEASVPVREGYIDSRRV